MGLINRIYKEMKGKSMKKVSLIVNGRYLTRKSQLVYVDISDRNGIAGVVFYTVNDGDNVPCDAAYSQLIQALSNGHEFGKCGPAGLDKDAATMIVNRSLNVIVLESSLYSALKELTKVGSGKTVTIGGYTYSRVQINEMLLNFRLKGFSNYQSVVFGESQRIVTRLRNRNAFYKIQNAFVPVFIDYVDIYNPFKDPNYANVQSTSLWQVASEKGRLVETEDESLSCWMVTHLEVCKAFGMKQFMRFTPEFLYRVFVGMKLGIPGFPNVIDKVYVRLDPDSSKYGYSKIYTESGFFAELQKVQELHNESDKEDKVQEMVQELQQYREMTTLEREVGRFRERLVSYGSRCLDDRENTTAAKLFQYLTQV